MLSRGSRRDSPPSRGSRLRSPPSRGSRASVALRRPRGCARRPRGALDCASPPPLAGFPAAFAAAVTTAVATAFGAAITAAFAVMAAAARGGRRHDRRRGPGRRSPPPARRRGPLAAAGRLPRAAAALRDSLTRSWSSMAITLTMHRVADPADVVDALDVPVGQLADVDTGRPCRAGSRRRRRSP